MFRPNCLVRDLIPFVGGVWRAAADLVRGRDVTMLYRQWVKQTY